MAYSYNTYGSRVAGQTIALSWPYLSTDHVYVSVDDVVVSSTLYTWTNSALLTCLTGFPTGNVTKVYRKTPVTANMASLIGAAILDIEGINKNDKQLLYAAQELIDRLDLVSLDLDTAAGMQAALDLKANKASPSFTGTPLAPTPTSSDNSTRIATTAFVKGLLSDLWGPGTVSNDMDTLTEIVDAIIALQNGKADKASPTFTGDPKAPTPSLSDNDTSIATTAFVKSLTAAIMGTGTPDSSLDTIIELADAITGRPTTSEYAKLGYSDWNNVVSNGIYSLANAANAPTNSGTTDWYLGRVMAHTIDYVEQIAYRFLSESNADPMVYRRVKYNGTWRAWQRWRGGQTELDARYGVMEAGTWTPTFQGTTVAGTISYDEQTGHYVAMGRMVWAGFAIEAGAIYTTNPTGNIVIAGLPFAADTPNLFGGGSIGHASNIGTLPANFGGWSLRMHDASRIAVQYINTSNGWLAALPVSGVVPDTRFVGSIVYRRA